MSVKEGMLPIPEHFTAALLDEFDPQFVEWMIKSLATLRESEDGKVGEGKEVLTVRRAIGKSEHFVKTMGAAMLSMRKTSESLGEESGEASLVVLLLIAGWKLAEYRMEQLARSSTAV